MNTDTKQIDDLNALRGRSEVILCPECGANRTLLIEMLNEPLVWIENLWMGRVQIESENHRQARVIISGCPACKEAFNGS